MFDVSVHQEAHQLAEAYSTLRPDAATQHPHHHTVSLIGPQHCQMLPPAQSTSYAMKASTRKCDIQFLGSL